MDITIASGLVSSGRLTLTPNEVTSVYFADNIGRVQVVSNGSASAYYTVDGSVPTVDGLNTFELPANVASVDERDTRNFNNEGDVVRLISSGSPLVRVQSV